MDDNQSPSQLSHSHSLALIMVFCLITIAIVYLVYTQVFIFGSEAGGWSL